jgi:hypothetical protein
MRVENLLTIFGILVVISGYAGVIVALVFIDADRNLYLLSGVAGVLIGTMMLGIAKAVNQQADVINHMDDLRRLVRNQLKMINDMQNAATTSTKKTQTNKAQANPTATTANAAAKKTPPSKPKQQA